MNKNSMNWHSPSMSRYMDKSTRIEGDSDYSVYAWFRPNGGAFYIGFGKQYRFTCCHPKARSKEFMDIYNDGGCYVKILSCGMSELDGRKEEREIIKQYHESGHKLVNKQYIVDYYHTPKRMEFLKRPRKKAINI